MKREQSVNKQVLNLSRRNRACTDIADIVFFCLIIFFIVLAVLLAFNLACVALTADGVITLVLAIAIGYISTIRPFLRRPRLIMLLEPHPIWSPMADDSHDGSWSLRIMVLNYGVTSAKNCVGRLLEIYTEDGKRLEKFDPMTLYWQRQDGNHVPFVPVSIQANGDFWILDVAKVEKGDEIPIKLRLVLQLDLAGYPNTYPSPGNKELLKEGVYYLLLSVHSDEASVAPCWFEISCSKIEAFHGADICPCQIHKKTPLWAK